MPRILENTKQTKKLDSSTSTPSPSSRAFEKGEAIHNKKVESSVRVESSEQVDCHATATALARNDRKNSPCEKLDSSKAPSPSSRADTIGVAIHNTKADSREMQAKTMDCRATAFALARNDRKNRSCEKLDSSTATILKTPAQDSKICGEKTSEAVQGEAQAGFFSKSGLCKHSQGRAFSVRNRLECLQNKALSPKAKSTGKAKLSQAQSIPLIDLHAQYHAYKPELDAAIASVLHSQHFILGEHSRALESELAEFVGRRFCITCSSGTSALLLALLALGIGKGDEVITPSFSFIAAAEMVAFVGAKPMFVDICPDTYTLDITQVRANISARTRAIIPVCLFGQPYDVSELAKVAGAIPIIEDGAQSFGAAIVDPRLDSTLRKSGSFGTLSVTSFFPSKPLGGYGDGGAIFCDDPALARKLTHLRNHGQASKYCHTTLGLNARLDELQCAILRVKLRHFSDELALRKQVAARYYALLSPLQSSLALPYIAPNRSSVFAQFCLRALDPSFAPPFGIADSSALDSSLESKQPSAPPLLDSAHTSLDSSPTLARDLLTATLSSQGIATAIHYPKPLHLQEVFKHLGYKQGDFPISERVAQEIFSIPFSPYLSQEAQEHIASALRTAFS